MDQLMHELQAQPYVAADAHAGEGSAYEAFEDVFRGPEERVRELLEPYVELLRDHAPVLDVGCGRGEFLDLLRDAGIEARGVDVDPGMVDRCRRKGHDVEQADAASFLERQPPERLGAVFAAHLIEHLDYEDLQRFFDLSRRALRPDGLLVAETVNPHSLSAFKTFWTDPSHRAPIFPEVAQALALIHGFAAADILFPRGSGDSDADRVEATEYALIARAG
jgi:SAM-dependent methyltransferase